MSNTILKGFVYANNIPTEGGYRLRDTTVTFFPAEDPNPQQAVPSLLIIGKEGAEPRVFSEEDVRKMIHGIVLDLNDAMDNRLLEAFEDRDGEYGAIFTKHGITL